METNKIVDSILETVKEEVTLFVEQESSIKCPIEYETRVINIARMMSRGIIQGTQGQIPKSRNCKKKS